MKRLTIAAVFQLSLLNFVPQLHAEELPSPNFIGKNLDTYIEQAIKDWKVPGLSISIVKDGKVVHLKGYGLAQIDQSKKIDKDSLFTLGSTTKAFTATAITSLAQQHGFSLDEPIKKWLPQFELSNQLISNMISIQDLLSHRSGLGKFQGDFAFFDSDFTKNQMMQKLNSFQLLNDFRAFEYTNIGYFLVGQAVEAVSGKTYENYLQDAIFSPLDMTRTTAMTKEFLAANNKAAPHTLENGKVLPREIGDISNMVAAGGISSSASDLSHWMIAQLGEGKYKGKQVISPKVIEQVRSPKILIGRSNPPYTIFNNSNFENYASGWYNIDYEGTEVVTHNGGTYGYSSSITIIPEHNLGIAILTNSDTHLLFETIKLEIIDAYLGLPYRNYSKIAQQFFMPQLEMKSQHLTQLKEKVKAAPTPILSLSKYEGTYKNDSYGNIEVSQKDEHLALRFQHHPDLVGTLQYINEGKFLSSFNKSVYGNTIIPFEIVKGKIINMNFSVDENVEPNKYTFTKYK